MFKKLSEEQLNSILEAGIDEFAGNGLDKTNINTIAKKAEVSVGVIYKYFEDKNSLFLACVRHSLKLLNEVLTKAAGLSDDIDESIRTVVVFLIDHAKKHSNHNMMYNEITSGSCKQYAKLLAGEIENISATVYKTLLETAKNNGRIRENADSRLFAFFFDNLLMMLQFSYSCEYYKERMKIFCGEDIFLNDERMIQGFTDFMKAALS